MAEEHDPMAERTRLPHVVMDRDTRVWKARKIIALIGEERFLHARRILEIGCGSGVIAATLHELGPTGLEVHAVDVVDSRSETSGYAFQLLAGTALPFADASFDIVISNHVIEHVGPRPDQLAHLREIHRVLASGGLGYLAVPNKWRLVEPHFRLPLLSWLPQSIADRYVQLARQGTHYECLPLSLSGAAELFDEAGFDARDATVDAFRATVAIEFAPGGAFAWLSRAVPDAVVGVAEQAMPTFVFLLRPRLA
jgi:ubiquinone/menaquinone biosynthesis C-methylase UbiE